MKYTVTQRKSDRRHTYSRLAAGTARLSTVSACTTMAPTPHTVESQACPGTTEPPPALQPYLAPVQDPTLLAQALGAPGKGGLCDGQVYEVTSASSIEHATGLPRGCSDRRGELHRLLQRVPVATRALKRGGFSMFILIFFPIFDPEATVNAA